jgi:hypothetical protein
MVVDGNAAMATLVIELAEGQQITGGGRRAGWVVTRVMVAAVALMLWVGVASAAQWTPVPVAGHVYYNAVSCPSAASCLILKGDPTDIRSDIDPQFFRYDGHRVSRLPRPVMHDPAGYLDSLDCRSARFCVAVGARPMTDQVAAERWNGRRWTVMHPPTPGAHNKPIEGADLSAVACPSRDECVAVGSVGHTPRHGPVESPLAERWDGRRWRALSAPFGDGELTSIDCASARRCTAVGTMLVGPEQQVAKRPVVVDLESGHWARLVRPAVAGELTSISCPVTADCVAVGYTGNEDQAPLTHALVLTEGVAGWTARTPTVAKFHANPTFDQLSAVSCVPDSVDRCVAVGNSVTRPGAAETQRGLSISITRRAVATDTISRDRNPLAISCPTLGFCLATGDRAIQRYAP